MSTNIAQDLIARGITHESHHMSLKKAYREITGDDLDKEGQAALRMTLEAAAAAPAPVEDSNPKPKSRKNRNSAKKDSKEKASPKQKAKKDPKPSTVDTDAFIKQAKKDDPAKWGRVVEVTETNAKGHPTRVVIECQDPEMVRNDTGNGHVLIHEPGEARREIATQDLFQVTRCEACQKRYLQVYRNERAKARRAARTKSSKK